MCHVVAGPIQVGESRDHGLPPLAGPATHTVLSGVVTPELQEEAGEIHEKPAHPNEEP